MTQAFVPRTRPLGLATCLVAALATLGTSAHAQEETLRHVRIDSPQAPTLAESMEVEGWDVVEGAVEATSFELIVSVQELAQLEADGFAPTLISIGKPFAEIAAARGDLAGDGVPTGYQALAQIEARMAQVAADHPNIAQFVDLTAKYGMPTTFEGRSLYAVKISDNVGQDEDEPNMLVVSSHHCRETVTPVIALKAIDNLTDGYGTDPVVTAAVDSHEIWIAPMWNPDGYNHVFTTDNNWRKNRRVFGGGIGVDQNRNYPQGWTAPCAGSTTITSQTYKGPSPASEPETQTMMAFALDRAFAKQIDYHSTGREVLWGYACSSHPFSSFYLNEAIAISNASGYNGDERPPTAEGEHYEWEFAQVGALSFLIETWTNGFQPPFADALFEANLVYPGIEWMLQREIPVWGHVTDACTGGNVAGAEVDYVDVVFSNGETNPVGGPFNRYHAWLPAGNFILRFTAPGYATQFVPVTVGATGSQQVDVALQPLVTTTVSGPQQPGTQLSILFDAPADAGEPYFGGATLSGTVPGLPLNGCTLPLNPDDVTTLAVNNVPPFSGFAGVLDGSGQATATLDLPAQGSLVGLVVDFAFLTLDGGNGTIRHPSDSDQAVIVP